MVVYTGQLELNRTDLPIGRFIDEVIKARGQSYSGHGSIVLFGEEDEFGFNHMLGSLKWMVTIQEGADSDSDDDETGTSKNTPKKNAHSQKSDVFKNISSRFSNTRAMGVKNGNNF